MEVIFTNVTILCLIKKLPQIHQLVVIRKTVLKVVRKVNFQVKVLKEEENINQIHQLVVIKFSTFINIEGQKMIVKIVSNIISRMIFNNLKYTIMIKLNI